MKRTKHLQYMLSDTMCTRESLVDIVRVARDSLHLARVRPAEERLTRLDETTHSLRGSSQRYC
jgi:hypothetical protein